MAAFTAIDDPGLNYKTKIYVGTGSTATITGVGFQPDWTWIKSRDDTYWHNLIDSVRGYNKYIFSNENREEDTWTDRLTSWNADGFVLSTDGNVNQNTDNYASYNWKGGTTTGIAGSPSITPTSYSFNQTAGFSIITYTGTGSAATLPHGLGVIPECMIVKQTAGNASNWAVYHKNMRYPGGPAEDYGINLNTTGADALRNFWDDTTPTSTLWYVGSGAETNQVSGTYVGYFFAGKQGYSKFGIYTGTGNADGMFVYTGFQPSYLMVKTINNAGQNWNLYDNKRHPYNSTVNNYFEPNDSTADGTSTAMNIDFLSNGFKPRGSNAGTNGSAHNYIYLAFAEAPFVNSSGVPANSF